MSATTHFKERVAQRIGPDVCGQALADRLVKAVAEGDEKFARFACRSRNGPVYRIEVEDKGTFYVAMNRLKNTAITILPAGGTLARKKGRRKKKLRGTKK
ncbi:hypothetical protein PAF17_15940 [Paracoccus sp. Z330]|uniref:Uncharacterized protein n=1 Tax=Paracoccus onchidii TaxID=3017813 RepID=A0ABT4ZI37_9RHOB|nr:hypothetical protein [Paracoccus onchidii]MDB6178983.1 hypothetical protein [Paracoccus onchidii]